MGNKTDLEGRRVISEQTARQFAEANSLEYFECSAVSVLCCSIFSIVVFIFHIRHYCYKQINIITCNWNGMHFTTCFYLYGECFF